MNKEKYIAYYRVSTKKQGRSGLGLQAQREMVERFVNCTDCIYTEYTDIETGKNDNRPELLKAIDQAKQTGYKLVIAKLDRLSRSAGFIHTLRDSGVDFVCADMPEANTLTIGIFASMAQYERELISERTKKALAAKKAAGWQPGTPENLTESARLKGLETRQHNAKESPANRQAKALIQGLLAQGLSYRVIADKLNDLGMRTRRGKEFKAMSVKRLV